MRKFAIALMTMTAVASMSMTALAASWNWLDINEDGAKECYYLADDGMFLTNTTTPDGYQVNALGQWTENGVVQTQGQVTSQAVYDSNGLKDGTYKLYSPAAAEWWLMGKLVISNSTLTIYTEDDASGRSYNYIGFGAYCVSDDLLGDGWLFGNKYQTADGSKIMWVSSDGCIMNVDAATGSLITSYETEEAHKWVDSFWNR